MASDIRKRWHMIPSAWIVSSVLLALAAGYCIALRSLLWLPFLICSGVCAFMIMRNLNRIIRQMRYIIEATLDGDFSYKFPTVYVSNEERASNIPNADLQYGGYRACSCRCKRIHHDMQ